MSSHCIFKRLVRLPIGPLFLCIFVVAIDVLSQQDVEMLNIGGWCYQIQQVTLWGGMLGSISFLLGRTSRWIYFPLLLFILINGIIESYVRRQFQVNYMGDWLLILQASSPEELLEYWSCNAGRIILYLLMILGAVFVLFWLLIKVRYPTRSWKSMGVACLLLMPMGIYCCGRSVGTAFKGAIFHRVVSGTFENASVFNDLGRVHSSPSGLENVKLTVPLQEAPTCVVVIGESATRNNLGVYGYERNTTPYLSSIKDELFIFTDLVGVWNNTPPAIRYLFTGASMEDKSHARMMITQAGKKAGYPQTFISNQSRWGSMNNMITYIFDSADQTIFMGNDVDPKKNRFDLALLPHFHFALSKSTKQGQIIYLHQKGSHYPFVGLYPTNETVFVGGKTIDHYDNTIYQTDKLIKDVIETLKELHRPAMMFYVSDHGETPRAKGWRNFHHRDLWEIPMVVWFSPEYKDKFPAIVSAVGRARDLPLQSDQVLPGLLIMMQIVGWEDSMSDKCFLNSGFVPRQPRIIKNRSEPYERFTSDHKDTLK